MAYTWSVVMTKRKPPDQIQKNGRKSTFLVQYIAIARRMAYLGATDRDLAAAFQTSIINHLELEERNIRLLLSALKRRQKRS